MSDFVAVVARGTVGKWYLTFQASRDPAVFTVAVTVDKRAGAFFEIGHVERRSNGQAVRYRVDLLTTPQPFGGERWCFRCPVTGDKPLQPHRPVGRFRGSWAAQ